MAGLLQPLGKGFTIVDEKGQPTDYFIRWAQQRQIDISKGVSKEDAEALILEATQPIQEELEDLSDNLIIAGEGLSGGGPISSNVTIDLEPLALDDLTDVDLTTPPVEGQVLGFVGDQWVPVDQTGGGGGETPAHSSHPYWRILAGPGQGFFAFTFVEIKFREDPTSSNQTIGGTPIASDGSSANAFDNNTSTFSQSNNFPGELSAAPYWIGYHFSSPVKVGQLEITARSGTNEAKQVPKNFAVQWSDDGTDYITAFEVSNATSFASGETRSFLNTAESGGGGGGIEEAPEDGQKYVRQDGAWVVLPAGGGGLVAQEVPPSPYKTSALYYYNGSSYAAALPAGTAIGDRVIFFWSNGYPLYPLSGGLGWNLINSANGGGSYTNVLMYEKVITQADLDTGTVTGTAQGGFPGVAGFVVYDGHEGSVFKVTHAVKTGGSQLVDLSSGSLVRSGRELVYIGHNRGNSLNTVSRGTQRQQVAGSSASGVITTEVYADLDVLTANFNFPTPGESYYCAIIQLATLIPA